MNETGGDRLKSAVSRWRHRRKPSQQLTVEPTSAFDVQVSERLKSMQRDVDQIRTRVNWLLGLILTAAVANILLSLSQ